MSNALVVRSMDLICTLALGLMGELACFIGLKLRIAERILFVIDWRVRSRVPKQFKVAVTSTASLAPQYQSTSIVLILTVNIPVCFAEDVEKSIQQSRSFWFQTWGRDQRVVSRDKGN